MQTMFEAQVRRTRARTLDGQELPSQAYGVDRSFRCHRLSQVVLERLLAGSRPVGAPGSRSLAKAVAVFAAATPSAGQAVSCGSRWAARHERGFDAPGSAADALKVDPED